MYQINEPMDKYMNGLSGNKINVTKCMIKKWKVKKYMLTNKYKLLTFSIYYLSEF